MKDQFSRREFIRNTGLGVMSLSSVQTGRTQAHRKPNILLLHVDQYRHDCLGVCGNKDVLTPNIDKLAADGVRYENSFCPYPVCTPSRYSLVSGQYVHEHRGFNNRSTLSPDIDTFPKLLRSAGYKTSAVGKMHYTPTYLDVGFDKMILSEQDGPGRWDDDYHRYLMKKGLVDRNDLVDQRSEYRKNASQEYRDSFGAMVSNLEEPHHSTTWVGRNAAEDIQSWDDSVPNLLMVGFIKPHHPFDPPAPWHEMYDPDKMNILPGWTEECLEHDYLYSKGYFDNKTVNKKALRKVMAYYYATISHIDSQIGNLIQLLKQKKMYDDTMIIFTSDHGDYLGFHHMLLKSNYLYDPLTKVPLIIKNPGSSKAGTVSSNMVNNIDLAPTILSSVGIKPAPSMKGFDLNNPNSGHETIFSGRTTVMARTRTLKLIQTKRKNAPNLFFDLQKDPLEMNNQYDNPKYQGEIKKLTASIDAWQPEEDRKKKIFVDHNAPQINQPNVPSLDLSHRKAIIEYYQKNT